MTPLERTLDAFATQATTPQGLMAFIGSAFLAGIAVVWARSILSTQNL